MARNLRGSQFNKGTTVGEDVNPSAYIVNLADCMLVLALGCLVALVGAFNINLNTTEIDRDSLEQVDPTELDGNAVESGSYYVEAGTVYMDPRTGELFMVHDSSDADISAAAPAEEAAVSGDSATASSTADSNESADSPATNDDDVRQARANGAD